MRISLSPDVLTAHVSGEPVLLNLVDKNYYPLNETAAAVWAGLERGETPDKILSTLLEKYDLAESEAAKQVDDVIADFRERKLIVDQL
ncbi:MAG TPA: PqqD family protein [Gemmatimonadaceae bacterium]|nr:PqqD family protein [Gemmatimonadaceae bacterium]